MNPLAALSSIPSMNQLGSMAGMGSVSMLISMAMGTATSVGFWGTVAHSLGVLPDQAFIAAENIGISLPPMPSR